MIVFLDTATLGEDCNEQLELFKELGEVKYFDITTPEQTKERIKGAEVIVTNKVVINKEMMQENPQLKLISIAATGMNNVDLIAANELGVEVKNAINYSSESVAQQTFAMLLSLLNHINEYDQYVKTGEYSKSPIFTWIGQSYSELNGKVYGIYGMGNIGRRVAEIASAFGARVIYFSTSGEIRDQRFEMVDFDEFLSQSDVVSIHAPLNEKTANAFGERELKAMKKSALLINVGRGGIVDEKALVEAINTNEISGAAVDVFVSEPMDKENPLLKVENKDKLILSPHIAWSSKEARKKLLQMTYANINATLN